MAEYFSGRASTIVADICGLGVDAIVNAANSTLFGGGGVDGAIHAAGGPAIMRECEAIRARDWPDGLPPGRAVATTGGRLRAGRVIHAVGPVWRGGHSGEPAVLASAYRSCLWIADEERLGSIAFPAISTGIYGYPRELAAPVVIGALASWLGVHEFPERVLLAFFKASDEEAFIEAAARSV